MQYVLKFAVLVLLLSSCKNYKTKYPYALRDFDPVLRVHLEKIIANGGICNDNIISDLWFLNDSTSVPELKKMTLCEHPLLRSVAFSALCLKGTSYKDSHTVSDLNDSAFDEGQRRNNGIVDSILLHHLDDTAIITYCRGEFGDDRITVSDNYIRVSRDRTKILRSSLFKLVVTKYPYLENAASFLLRDEFPLLEKKYQLVKEFLAYNHYLSREKRKELLIALAGYKSPADTAFLAAELNSFSPQLEEGMFLIIEKNPVKSYFFALKKFYRSMLRANDQEFLQEDFLKNSNFQDNFKDFIRAVAAYRSNESDSILTDIIHKNLFKRDIEDHKHSHYNELSFKYELFYVLKDYNCPNYKNLFPLVEEAAKKFEKKYVLGPLPLDSADIFNLPSSKFW